MNVVKQITQAHSSQAALQASELRMFNTSWTVIILKAVGVDVGGKKITPGMPEK